MIEKVNFWSFFLLAFFLPFQGIPKINIFGMNVRFGILFILPVILMVLFNLKELKSQFFKIDRGLILSLASFFIFSAIVTLINPIDSRSLGFIIWLGVSIFIFLMGGLLSGRAIIHGALYGQGFNILYIVLQFFFHEAIWVPDSFYKLTFMGKLRAYGLMGEPSYLAIMLIPCLVYSNSLENIKKRYAFNILFVFGLMFSYSRIALLALLILLLIELIRNLKESIKFLIPIIVVFTSLSIVYNPQYYGIKSFQSVSDEKFEKRKISKVLKGYEKGVHPLRAGSTNQRLLSLKRGVEFLSKNLIGVGLGNSHRELRKYFSAKLEKVDFSRRDRWKKEVEGVHNIFLEVAIEAGIVGLLLFLGFLFQIGVRLRKLKLNTEMIMFLGMLFCMQFAQNINMPAMWIILTYCLYRIQESQENES